jgi:hypothetical protein
MTGVNFRNAYEFDPNSYGTGGLLGRLQALLPQAQPSPDIGTSPNGRFEFDPASYRAPQGGLLGRLLALQAEQSQYSQIPTEDEQAPFVPRNPNFRQLSRAPSASSVSPVARTESAASSSEPDQAQLAREVAAVRLACGVRSPNRAAAANAPETVNPINGALRAYANGFPITGAFNNKIEAALEAGLAPVLNPFLNPENQLTEQSFPQRYEHALRGQNDIDARFAKEHPAINALASFLGGMSLFGPLGKMPTGAKMLGLTEGPLLEMMLRGALTRAGIWGMDAAARGNTDKWIGWPMIAGAFGPIKSRYLPRLP